MEREGKDGERYGSESDVSLYLDAVRVDDVYVRVGLCLWHLHISSLTVTPRGKHCNIGRERQRAGQQLDLDMKSVKCACLDLTGVCVSWQV